MYQGFGQGPLKERDTSEATAQRPSGHVTERRQANGSYMEHCDGSCLPNRLEHSCCLCLHPIIL
jgi:hypothetical protein